MKKFIFLPIALAIAFAWSTIVFFTKDIWEEYFICIKYSLLGCYWGFEFQHTIKGSWKEMNEFVELKLKEYEERRGRNYE